MGINVALRKYHQQRGVAKARNIDFQFTFEEWVSWWEANLGPDWMKLRGRRRDQFVMSRCNDVGPYVGWNVRCILSIDNYEEAHPKRLLTEIDVRTIFTDCRPYKMIAKEYKISTRRIASIKNRKEGNDFTYLLDRFPS